MPQGYWNIMAQFQLRSDLYLRIRYEGVSPETSSNCCFTVVCLNVTWKPEAEAATVLAAGGSVVYATIIFHITFYCCSGLEPDVTDFSFFFALTLTLPRNRLLLFNKSQSKSVFFQSPLYSLGAAFQLYAVDVTLPQHCG